MLPQTRPRLIVPQRDGSLRYLSLIMAGALALAPTTSTASTPLGFVDQPQVTGLERPVGFTFLPDGRILIVEQLSGAIRAAENGVVSTLTVVPDLVAGGEQGLLGIAVDPRWPAAPYIYVHFTRAGFPSTICVTRYALGDDFERGGGGLSIDPASRFDVLNDIPNDDPIHNGGTLRFGPDRMLYVSIGDDAIACRSQDTTSLNGKILRLDVRNLPDGPGGPADKALLAPADNPFASHPDPNARLVWAMGLRNPFRFNIHPTTGEVFVADVGQDEWEELDIASTPGLNYGWPWREGPWSLGMCGENADSGFVEPTQAFDHGEMSAIISGSVYTRNGGRHQFPPEYDGDFFFSDYGSGNLLRLENTAGVWSIAPPVIGQPSSRVWADGLITASDYSIGPDGALWYASNRFEGSLNRIAYVFGIDEEEPPPGPDVGPEDPVYYDLQGRRVDDPKQNGLYFTRTGKRKVVLR